MHFFGEIWKKRTKCVFAFENDIFLSWRLLTVSTIFDVTEFYIHKSNKNVYLFIFWSICLTLKNRKKMLVHLLLFIRRFVVDPKLCRKTVCSSWWTLSFPIRVMKCWIQKTVSFFFLKFWCDRSLDILTLSFHVLHTKI